MHKCKTDENFEKFFLFSSACFFNAHKYPAYSAYRHMPFNYGFLKTLFGDFWTFSSVMLGTSSLLWGTPFHYCGGYHHYCGGYYQCTSGFSVLWGEGYHQYCGDNTQSDWRFPPQNWLSSTVLVFSSTVLKTISMWLELIYENH